MTADAGRGKRTKRLVVFTVVAATLLGMVTAVAVVVRDFYRAPAPIPAALPVGELAGVASLAHRDNALLDAVSTICERTGCEPSRVTADIYSSSAAMEPRDLRAALKAHQIEMADIQAAITSALRQDDQDRLEELRTEAELSIQIAAHHRSLLRMKSWDD